MLAAKENFYEGTAYRSSESCTNGSSLIESLSGSTDYESVLAGHRHYPSEPTQWSFPDSEISDPVYVRDSSVSSVLPPLPRVDSESNLNPDARIEEHFIGVRTSEEAAAAVKPDDFALYYKNESCKEVRPSIPLYLVHRIWKNLKLQAHLTKIPRPDMMTGCRLACSNMFLLVWKITVGSKRHETRTVAQAAAFGSGAVETAVGIEVGPRRTAEVFHFPVRRLDEDNGSQWWHVEIGSNKLQSFRQLSDLVRCYHLYRFTDARSGRMEVFPLWKGGVVDDFE
ncbi:hypothetical protein RB195_007644 [Necator americanus]|uniref:Uncharacterized protein n=1 Tax=Necator americanus TaxID=51031 RepID=A0ABR1BZT6_NECAM